MSVSVSERYSLNTDKMEEKCGLEIFHDHIFPPFCKLIKNICPMSYEPFLSQIYFFLQSSNCWNSAILDFSLYIFTKASTTNSDLWEMFLKIPLVFFGFWFRLHQLSSITSIIILNLLLPKKAKYYIYEAIIFTQLSQSFFYISYVICIQRVA